MQKFHHYVLTVFASGLLFSFSSCSNAEPAQTSTPAGSQRNTITKEEKETSLETAGVVFGKYGCTFTKYSNGSYEYIPKGSFILKKNGEYAYYGFEKPSAGTFSVDEQGNLLFEDGYFAGGKAEKIDRPNKFFLTFPKNPGIRWTCGLIEE